MTLWIVAALLFCVAFVFSNAGLGGGLLTFPILSAAYTEWSPANIVAMTLLVSVATLLATVAGNLRRKKTLHIRFDLALLAGVAMAAGAYGGAQFTITSGQDVVRGVFAVVLAAIAIKLARTEDGASPRRRANDAQAKNERPRARAGLLGAAAGFAGFLSGSVGIGAGVVLVPILAMAYALDARSAVATASIALLIGAVTGWTTYAVLHPVPYDVGLTGALVVATFLGGSLGCRFGFAFLKTQHVRNLVIVVLWATVIVTAASLFGPRAANACPRTSGNKWGQDSVFASSRAAPFGPAIPNCRTQRNADVTALYFTRLSSDGALALSSMPSPGIYVSTLLGERWSAPTLLVPHGRWPSLTRDESWMFFGCDAGICSFERRTGTIRTVRFLGVTPLGSDMPAVDPDGTKLIFTAKGSGGTDLYISHRLSALPDAVWSSPIRLNGLSGHGAEGRPFMSYDGERLFFSSASSELIGDSASLTPSHGHLLVSYANAAALQFDAPRVIDETGCL